MRSRRLARAALASIPFVVAAAIVFWVAGAGSDGATAQAPIGDSPESWGTPVADVIVSTLAGSGAPDDLEGGFRDGDALQARFSSPAAVAVGPDGTTYVADFGNNVIRAIATDGVVTTFAGNGELGWADGPAQSASFAGPAGIAVDGSGNVYVSDAVSHLIRVVTPDRQVNTVAGSVPAGTVGKDGSIALGVPEGGFADGGALEARFNKPAGIAVDSAGRIYVADKDNHRIRMIANGVVSTLAGGRFEGTLDGQGGAAQLAFPVGLALRSDGSIVFSEQGQFAVREVTADGTVRTLVKASGPSGLAGVAVDPSGLIFVADMWSSQVRFVTPAGSVGVLVGTTRGFVDGPGTVAELGLPTGLALSPDGELVVADQASQRIRLVTGLESLRSDIGDE